MTMRPRRQWALWRPLIVGTAEGRNLGWLTIERVVQLIVSFGVGVVVARHLGAADFGRLAYAVALATLLTPFVTVGQSLVVRDISTGIAPVGVVLGNAAALSTAATVLAAGGILLIGQISPGAVPAGTSPLIAVVVAGTIIKPAGVVDAWFQATLAARRATLARNMAVLIGAAARIVAVILGATVLAFAGIVSAEALLASVLMLAAYARAGGRMSRWTIDLSHLRALTRQSLPLLGASISVIIYMRIDQVMLGALSGVTQNGRYAISVNFSELAWFVPLALNTAMSPRMARLWKHDETAFAGQLQRLFVLATAAAYAVVGFTVMIVPWFIPVAYGHQYAGVVPVVIVLSMATPFVFLGVVQDTWTVNANRQGLALMRTLVAAALNIALNFALLPRYGALGAAISTVVSYAVAAVIGNLLSRRSRFIWTMQMRALALLGLPAILRNPEVLRGAV